MAMQLQQALGLVSNERRRRTDKGVKRRLDGMDVGPKPAPALFPGKDQLGIAAELGLDIRFDRKDSHGMEWWKVWKGDVSVSRMMAFGAVCDFIAGYYACDTLSAGR